MKFLELVKMLKKEEKNKDVIVLVKCGAFFISIGADAVWLSQNLNFKTTCITNHMCKIGIPINSIYEYIDKLEILGYSFVIYNYSKEMILEAKNKYAEMYRYKGKSIYNVGLECENCEYYKKHKGFDNISLFDGLKKLQEEKEELRNGKK